MKRIHTDVKIECRIPCHQGHLRAEAAIPLDPKALVIFSQWSGGSWSDGRNWNAVWELHSRGFATLLVDLLSAEESELDPVAFQQFEIPLLTDRLMTAIRWALQEDHFAGLAIGCFGTDDGAAAAIQAATRMPEIRALVCRSTPADLVEDVLNEVKVPTLFLVAESDQRTIGITEKALAGLHGVRKMSLVEGASHSFSEDGVLLESARLAANWFEDYLADPEDSRTEGD